MARRGRGEENEESRRLDDEIARYRRAAEATLEQLEWCINYLYRLQKGRIAQALEQNRRQIERELKRGNG